MRRYLYYALGVVATVVVLALIVSHGRAQGVPGFSDPSVGDCYSYNHVSETLKRLYGEVGKRPGARSVHQDGRRDFRRVLLEVPQGGRHATLLLHADGRRVMANTRDLYG